MENPKARSKSGFQHHGENTKNDKNNIDKKKKKKTFKSAIKSVIMMLNGGHQSQANKKQIKRVSLSVLVLGRQGVGKTSLIKALIGEEFTGDYCPTVLDVYTKETIIDNLYVKFEFIDISGSHSFPAMRKLYIEKANVFLLVYDKERESHDELLRLKTEIEQIRGTHISELPVAVIKSRCDTLSSVTTSSSMRRSRHSNRSGSRKTLHDTRDDENISRWCGTVFNCSAKQGTNIAEVDEYLLSEGSFADSTTTTTAFSRHAAHRVSGRYIYGGRRHSKSIILNRIPDDRLDANQESNEVL